MATKQNTLEEFVTQTMPKFESELNTIELAYYNYLSEFERKKWFHIVLLMGKGNSFEAARNKAENQDINHELNNG